MTGSNKILTVSYGTFSCTLEGFDDPFGTMRGIAEYFRDLAADDRYFGAEPPTPDVEMLQNIAQKDVQRRVEARVGETGVELRQVTEAAEAPAAPEPTPPAKPAPQIEEAETLDSGPLAFDDEYLMPDEPEDVFTVDTEATPVEDNSPVETVAEKLRRIRAVVSRSLEVEESHEPFSVAPAKVGNAGADADERKVRSRAMTETIASITADIADEFEADEDEGTVEIESAPSQDAQLEDQDDEAEFESPAIANLVAVSNDDEFGDEEDGADNAFESIAELGENVGVDDVADYESVDVDTNLIDDVNDPTPYNIEESTDDDDAMLASVGKIVSSEADADDPGDGKVDTSDNKPADLEVDQDEAKLPQDAAEFDVATNVETPRQPSAPLSPIHESNGDVGRLLEETDHKLKDDEGIRRRRVISQMRAAVAATKADRIFTKIISREVSDAAEQTPYRKDLDRAISRNPDTEAAANVSRPAPLVLVSSQRVDAVEVKTPASSADVLAQRLEKSADDAHGSANFRDFATKMGATELPDLLEAAAAYSAFIEGEPHFSRPEIMKRVARADPALQLSRETGLRTFGQLLRQGKIQKLQRGQFTVADDTKFNPAQRIAGE